MKTHYETLGVATNATQDEIKKAFRKMASANHSDRGGDDTVMAAINVAYEILSDPERRARYDETGEDTSAISIEHRGMNIVVGRAIEWAQATEDGEDDMIDFIRNMTHNDRVQFMTAVSQAERLRVKLQKILTKINYKGEKRNIIRDALESRVADIDAKIPQIQENIAFADAALAILRDYEYEMQRCPSGPPYLLDLSRFTGFAR